ncbi:hypothetical protein Barb4_04303 [Bacteroidales bacterium Barb4]|nr:hypothetical protein Barb4_04303 [Bacteroidales bacterium Barb4]
MTMLLPMPSTAGGSFKVCRFSLTAKHKLPIEARAWCRLKSMSDSRVAIKALAPMAERSLPCEKSSDARSEPAKAKSPI